MKGPVVSAWLAAGLVLAASGARAESADCDLFCHLQGYLSTDHMAAAPGTPPSSAGAPAKPRHQTASAPKKAALPGAKRTATPATAVTRTATAATPADPAVAPAEPHKPSGKAAAHHKPDQAAGSKTAEAAPEPDVPNEVARKPQKHSAAVAAASRPPAETASAPAALPKPAKRVARVLPRPDRKDPPRPLAAAAELIPGSAQLVPAEFQTFGHL